MYGLRGRVFFPEVDCNPSTFLKLPGVRATLGGWQAGQQAGLSVAGLVTAAPGVERKKKNLFTWKGKSF